MPLSLAPGITFCIVDGTRLFLDRNRDRYFALGPRADAAFAAIGMRGGNADAAAPLAALMEADILVDDPFGEAPRPCRPLALTSSPLDDGQDLPASYLGALRSAAGIRLAQWELRKRGFGHVCRSVERLAIPSQDARPIGPCELGAIAGRFARAARIVGAFEQCLPIAIAMIRFCRRRGYAAQFAIGVKTRPFQAHAWVAAEGVVLTDPLATAGQFTPILIL